MTNFDMLPPPRENILPIIDLVVIHKDIKAKLGIQMASAFSQLMIREKIPSDPAVIKKLYDFLSSRRDYISQATAQKLEKCL